MPRIEVDPQVVVAASKQVQQAGNTAKSAAEDLAAAKISDPGFSTPEAIARFSSTWSSGLTAFAKGCDSVSSRFTATSQVYVLTEQHLTQGF